MTVSPMARFYQFETKIDFDHAHPHLEESLDPSFLMERLPVAIANASKLSFCCPPPPPPPPIPLVPKGQGTGFQSDRGNG